MLAIIKGAGDLASGVAFRMKQAGFNIIMTDIAKPTSIRRTVCFSEAILKGKTFVEGLEGLLANNPDEAIKIANRGDIAVCVDPEADIVSRIKPDVLIDAILAKRNINTHIQDAPVVIALGPGFYAGKDCHAVIETKRGHYLGRIIFSGKAEENTGCPGIIAGYSVERILRAPCNGIFESKHKIGDFVSAGEICAFVSGEPIRAQIAGVIRGILPDGTDVCTGMKSGDVDPRGIKEYCYTISDKALAVGGAACIAALALLKTN